MKTRREILGSAAAAAVAVSIPVGALVASPAEEPIHAAMRAHAEAERAFIATFDVPEDERDEDRAEELSHAAAVAAWAMLDIEIQSQNAFDDFLDYVAANFGALTQLFRPIETYRPESRALVIALDNQDLWDEGATKMIAETVCRLRGLAWRSS
jgi:hypothetical protein